MRSLSFVAQHGPCPAGCGREVRWFGRNVPPLCDECAEREDRVAMEEAAKRQRQREQDALRQRQDDLPRFLRACGVAPRYSTLTRASWGEAFKPFELQTVKSVDGEPYSLDEISARWLRQADPARDWLVVFFGRHGRRKTGLATAILGDAIVAGHSCQWIDAESWVDALEWGVERSDVEGWRPWAEVYQRAALADRLVIDDLGAVRAGRTGRRATQDWWKERLALLLRRREMDLAPTIVTSNLLKLDDLHEINHSLPSRLRVPLAFQLGGPDFRVGTGRDQHG